MSRAESQDAKPSGRKSSSKRKVSKYRGVSWHKGNRRWRATIHIANKGPKHVGYFDDDVEAAKARDVAVMSLRGRPKLNFPAHTYFNDDPEHQELAPDMHGNGHHMDNNQSIGPPLADEQEVDLDIGLNVQFE